MNIKYITTILLLALLSSTLIAKELKRDNTIALKEQLSSSIVKASNDTIESKGTFFNKAYYSDNVFKANYRSSSKKNSSSKKESKEFKYSNKSSKKSKSSSKSSVDASSKHHKKHGSKSKATTLLDGQILIENKLTEFNSSTYSFSMDLILDNLTLKSCQRVILTPMIKDDNNNMAFLPQIVIDGRRRNIEFQRNINRKYDDDITEIRRYNGTQQMIHYKETVSYDDWMQNSQIIIDEDFCSCKKIISQKDVSVKDKLAPKVAFIRPEASPKTRSSKGTAYIDFTFDNIVLDPTYRKNPEELDKIVASIDMIQKDVNVSLDHIDICGFASPEGTYSHNEYLAENRAKTLKDYVSNLMSINDSLFTVSSVAENWDGLKEAIEGSSIENKSEILDLLQSDDDPDTKESKIKSKYPQEYQNLYKEYYPSLRKSDYTISYTVRPFTVEEAKEIIKTKPEQLSLEEMYLLAQTLDPSSQEFKDVFSTAVQYYPDDEIANFNEACIEIELGNYEKAKTYLAKSKDDAYTWNALGIVESMQGNTTEAIELFSKASKAGLKEAQKNLEDLTN